MTSEAAKTTEFDVIKKTFESNSNYSYIKDFKRVEDLIEDYLILKEEEKKIFFDKNEVLFKEYGDEFNAIEKSVVNFVLAKDRFFEPFIKSIAGPQMIIFLHKFILKNKELIDEEKQTDNKKNITNEEYEEFWKSRGSNNTVDKFKKLYE